MRHLERLGNSFSITLPTDKEEYTGRQCPKGECKGYFKITLGTGLPDATDCYCPYCGYTAEQSEFHTPKQIKYAKSIVARQITDAIYKDFKRHEFNIKPAGDFGIGISLEVKRDRPIRIQRYREKELETQIICENCSLRYAVYGVFAYCPDCGRHNSRQVLVKNLELISKTIDLAAEVEQELAARLIENALEDCVSSFDGFARELIRVATLSSPIEQQGASLHFQNLGSSRRQLMRLF
ncbi:MAG: hypothetical protein IID14_03530, partial [Candidatus Marinimicrobia bacterium]|nr:hypothetical protein [Candidatus Neomarinimicrobiota bacterium]